MNPNPNPDPAEDPSDDDIDAVASLQWDLISIAKRSPITLDQAAISFINDPTDGVRIPDGEHTAGQMLGVEEYRNGLLKRHAKLSIEWAIHIHGFAQIGATSMIECAEEEDPPEPLRN